MFIDQALKKTINALPLSPGVYIYRDKGGKVIYVGKSVRLRDRVKSYFDNIRYLEPKTKKLVSEIVKIDHIKTETELEALILEAALIKQHKPRYNIQGKDDKNYFFIEIKNGQVYRSRSLAYVVDKELWPAVKLTHQTKNSTSLYFGPFINGQEVKKALKVLRRIFKWCQYSSHASWRRHKKKACFYRQINLCPGICDNTIDLKTYWQSFRQLILFLESKKQTVIKDLEKQMRKLAKKEKFEDAAKVRDLIDRLQKLTDQYRSPADYLKNPNLSDDINLKQLSDLIVILTSCHPDDSSEAKLNVKCSESQNNDSRGSKTSVLRSGVQNDRNNTQLSTFTIEAYDISHLGTEYGVGSRVVFAGGQPVKNKYRQYKLSTQVPNDYQALVEVLTRRFKKTNDLPDLILIDGGKGQVAKVQAIADRLGIGTPIVGLAKRPDRLVIYDQTKQAYQIVPVASRPAGKLLTRLRNEAHRFANNYRKKVMKKQNK